MSTTKIQSITMGSVYTSDFKKSLTFYKDVLGLEGQAGENSCYFQVGDEQGFFLEGGYNRRPEAEKPECAALTFGIGSAGEMFKKLKDAGINTVQESPNKMAENLYWFQCYDPTGIIVEFMGGE